MYSKELTFFHEVLVLEIGEGKLDPFFLSFFLFLAQGKSTKETNLQKLGQEFLNPEETCRRKRKPAYLSCCDFTRKRPALLQDRKHIYGFCNFESQLPQLAVVVPEQEKLSRTLVKK